MNQSAALPSQTRLPRPSCGSAALVRATWLATRCSWTAATRPDKDEERQGDKAMRGAVLYGPRDGGFVERDAPRIVKPTDAIIPTAVTCVCGSALRDYPGLNPITQR